jgi:aromatase
MTEPRTWTTRQTVNVAAPPKRVFELLANIDCWPTIFDSIVTVERLGFDGVSERIRYSVTAGMTWTSLRETNPKRMQVRFRHIDPEAPFVSMGGLWRVVPKGDGAQVALNHHYRLVDDSPLVVARTSRVITANSAAMLGALRRNIEAGDLGNTLGAGTDSAAPVRKAS